MKLSNCTLLVLALMSFTFTDLALTQTIPTREEAIQRRAEREAAEKKRRLLEGEELKQFFRTIEFNQTKELRTFLRKGISPEQVNEEGNTALMVAARSGNYEVVRILANAGASINTPNRYGDTPIMVAALEGRSKIVQFFIDHGVSVNKSGWTALHYAANNGHNDVVNLLIDNLADIDASAPNGATPLMMAVREGRTDTVELLLQRGASVTAKTDKGDTALDWARSRPNNNIIVLIEDALKAKKK